MKKKIVSLGLLALLLGACVFAPSPRIDSSYTDETLDPERRAMALLSSMTLEEKIGQITLVDRAFLHDPMDIATYHLGALLSGGGSAPDNNSAEGWADMYDEYQSVALQTRLEIPLIYGVDAVHGHNNVRGAVIFPHNIGLGATRNADLVREIARITAIEVAGTGIDWTFAPCITVPRDERWGRTYEGFGETPELVALLGAAAIAGYQGEDLSHPETILANAKHFVADGGTTNGRDQGNAEISEDELREIHLAPYVDAIEAGVGSVMASYSSWNGEKVHGDSYLLTDVLEDELGFEGLLVSDWAAVNQLPGNYDEQLATAINAGIDMVMVPDDYRKFIETMKQNVRSGAISRERIDAAVYDILVAKFELGLFERPLTDRKYTELMGHQDHRDLGRQAVRESLVLLKNDNNVLPLSRDIDSLLIAGKNADNLGSQSGGWTIEWQGQRGNDLTEGTTILQGISDLVSDSTSIVFSVGGNVEDEPADTAVVVIGESPYAESRGDSRDLSLHDNDIEVVRKLKERGMTVITVLISGRPMIVNEVLELSDAFIAAWLPGTEGAGVADVLFGDYAPTGTLPHTWPASMDQIPINRGDGSTDEPLFDYGFGLSYSNDD